MFVREHLCLLHVPVFSLLFFPCVRELGLIFLNLSTLILISLLFLPSHLHRLLLSSQLPHTYLPSLHDVISAY